MLESAFLSLSGHGYLHDVRSCQSGEHFATLNLIYQFNNTRSDDVWFKCQFDMTQFPVLARIERYLAKKETIILKFDAKYSGFQQCYSEMSDNDPRLIVQLHGELLHVDEYYVGVFAPFIIINMTLSRIKYCTGYVLKYKMEQYYG